MARARARARAREARGATHFFCSISDKDHQEHEHKWRVTVYVDAGCSCCDIGGCTTAGMEGLQGHERECILLQQGTERHTVEPSCTFGTHGGITTTSCAPGADAGCSYCDIDGCTTAGMEGLQGHERECILLQQGNERHTVEPPCTTAGMEGLQGHERQCILLQQGTERHTVEVPCTFCSHGVTTFHSPPQGFATPVQTAPNFLTAPSTHQIHWA